MVSQSTQNIASRNAMVGGTDFFAKNAISEPLAGNGEL